MEKLDYRNLKELVLQAKEGKEEAFTSLYEKMYDLMLYKANQVLRDLNVSEDAVQETFILAFKNLHDLKDEMLFVSWISSINAHVSLQMLKKRKRELLELSENEESDTETFFFDGFEDSLMLEEEKQLVRRAVQNLPELERRVIVYHFFEEMKIDDIAEALEISRSTVKRKLKSAEELLKESLGTYETGEI